MGIRRQQIYKSYSVRILSVCCRYASRVLAQHLQSVLVSITQRQLLQKHYNTRFTFSSVRHLWTLTSGNNIRLGTKLIHRHNVNTEKVGTPVSKSGDWSRQHWIILYSVQVVKSWTVAESKTFRSNKIVLSQVILPGTPINCFNATHENRLALGQTDAGWKYSPEVSTRNDSKSNWCLMAYRIHHKEGSL